MRRVYQILLQIAAIILCYWILVEWYVYAFALGEFLLGTGRQPSAAQVIRYIGPLCLIVGILFVIGWTAVRWPLLQPALAVVCLIAIPARNSELSDWHSFLGVSIAIYAMALGVSAGAFALKKREKI